MYFKPVRATLTALALMTPNGFEVQAKNEDQSPCLLTVFDQLDLLDLQQTWSVSFWLVSDESFGDKALQSWRLIAAEQHEAIETACIWKGKAAERQGFRDRQHFWNDAMQDGQGEAAAAGDGDGAHDAPADVEALRVLEAMEAEENDEGAEPSALAAALNSSSSSRTCIVWAIVSANASVCT